jgi:hypothetical protein
MSANCSSAGFSGVPERQTARVRKREKRRAFGLASFHSMVYRRIYLTRMHDLPAQFS